MENALLHTNEEEETQLLSQHSEFQKFLERDEKIALYKADYEARCDSHN